MSAIGAFTLYQDIKDILEYVVAHPGVAYPDPIFPDSNYYTKFLWGRRPTSCEQGRLIYAYPDGTVDTPRNNCDFIRGVTFHLGIVQTDETETGMNAFMGQWNRLQEILGENSGAYQYMTDFKGISAPFGLGQLGVSNSRISGGSQYLTMKQDKCTMYLYEMLVTWDIYFAIRKTRNIST